MNDDALFDFDFQVEPQTFTIEGHPKGHFASVKSRLKTRVSISRDLTVIKMSLMVCQIDWLILKFHLCIT